MATYSSFQIGPATQLLEYRELNFGGLYLYHTHSGPKPNQKDIIRSQNVSSFGRTIVNNWEVYDGLGPGSKIVARGQGLHIEAGNWHNCFSLVFEDGRFKGSTFQLMGLHRVMWEWAIVGGTGELTMATGVIKKVLHESKADGNIFALTVKAFCPVLNGSIVRTPDRQEGICLQSQQSPAIKIGPWGGAGGSALDISDGPKHLESITIHSGDVVDSIEFSYTDLAGQRHFVGPWGGRGGNPYTIQLAANEFVTEMSGTVGTYGGDTVITSLKVVTNLQTLGPCGKGTANPFTVPVQNGSGIVSFFARAGSYINSIGVYARPI